MKVETTALLMILAIAACDRAGEPRAQRPEVSDTGAVTASAALVDSAAIARVAANAVIVPAWARGTALPPEQASWLLLAGDSSVSVVVETRTRVDTVAGCKTGQTASIVVPDPPRDFLMLLAGLPLRAGYVQTARVPPADVYDDDPYGFGWPTKVVLPADSGVLSLELNRIRMDEDPVERDVYRIHYESAGTAFIVVDWMFRYDDDDFRLAWAGDLDRDGKVDIAVRRNTRETNALTLHLSTMRTAGTWPAVATYEEPACPSLARPRPEPESLP